MIIDLHCDMLGCIEANEGRLSFHSPEINCSLPQLEQGGVTLQTLAIYTATGPGSSLKGERQLALYHQLLPIAPKNLHFRLAIENGSSLIEESEPLDVVFSRLDTIPNPLYISLTWNDENRFGGGNATHCGLKADGKTLLEYLSGKNIAIDFSHTSDALADDIFNHIDKQALDILPIASHSNFRTICDHPRNLPDPIAQEIIRRGGLIGINFVRAFVGPDPSHFIAHIDHALTLGGERNLCFGADFFGALGSKNTYFPHLSNSSCYPRFISLLRSHFSAPLLTALSHQNAEKLCKK